MLEHVDRAAINDLIVWCLSNIVYASDSSAELGTQSVTNAVHSGHSLYDNIQHASYVCVYQLQMYLSCVGISTATDIL